MISTAPLPTAPTKATLSRKEFIEQRRRSSTLWQIIHLFGSLQLALVLLAVLAMACAIATFYESNFSAAIARHYIYKAPWFLAWLGLLCLNLLAVTLTRWPWEKKHLGFVITHYSIITLLIGAVIGSHWGFEGNVTLHKERPPVTRVTTSRSIIQIEDPNSTFLLLRPFDAAVTRPRPDRPIHLAVPGTPWQIEALDQTPHLVREEILLPSPSGHPGALLELSSTTAGQTFRLPLVLGSPDNSQQSLAGLAEIELLSELPPIETRTLHENRMVLARFAPVSQGAPTSLQATLSPDGQLLRLALPDAAISTYRLKEILGQEIIVSPDTRLTVQEFWPDFVLENGQPASASPDPKNPAALLRIEQTQFRTTSNSNPDSPAAPPSGLQAQLVLAPDASGLKVRFLRNGQIASEPSEIALATDESIPTGWNDWQMRLLDFGPSVALTEQLRPARPGFPAEETALPGFLARLQTPELTGEPLWVESGKVTTLTAGSHRLRIGYGLQTRPLPFAIRLLNFEVPRFEGTSTPANFISSVEFRDPTTGETIQDVARMNKPAIWPAGLAPVLTGFNYKFSQAEWNPQDLNETTLQVLHDPGWMLKWIGSLGICAGIGLMFYWKPKK